MLGDRPTSEWKFTGMVSCVRYIAQTQVVLSIVVALLSVDRASCLFQGVGALWSGAIRNMLRTVATGVVLVLYGEVMLAWNKSNNPEETEDEEVEAEAEDDT